MVTHTKLIFNPATACTKCLLPEPYAKLNSEQICQDCINYTPWKLQGLDALEELFANIRGRYHYDCMVAVSGGRDSAYALHIAKNVLKLETLAYNHDNEMAHPQAIENMQTMCRNLDVDFSSVKSKKKYCSSIVADLVRSYAQFGPNVLKTVLCGPCNVGAYLGAKKVATEKKIPVVFLGNSDEEKLPDELRKPAMISFKTKLSNRQMPFYVRAQLNKFRHRLELSSSLSEIINLKFSPKNDDPDQQHIENMTIISVFNYVKWDRRELVKTIEEKLGWQKPESQKSSWRFDCHLVALVNYLWVKAYGYPKAFFGHVKMIRSGTMDKQEALDQLLGNDWGQFTPQMENVLKKELGVEDRYIDIIKFY